MGFVSLPELLLLLIFIGIIFVGLATLFRVFYVLIFKLGGADHFCMICGEHLKADRSTQIWVCDLCLNNFDRRASFYEKKFQEYLDR